MNWKNCTYKRCENIKKVIVNKEYTTLLRDKRFKIMGGLISFLLLVALLGGSAYRLLCKRKVPYLKWS